jgi:hypothetical protein
MKRASKVCFREDDEPYLKYTNRDPLLFQTKLASFILPSSNDALLNHYNQVASFLDDIYDMLYQRELDHKKHGDDIIVENHYACLLDSYNEDEERAKESERERIKKNLEGLKMAKISETLFQWHSDIASRNETMQGVYAICYFLSWVSFARIFHLAIYSQNDKLTLYSKKLASKDTYCLLASKSAHILISSETVIEYRISDIWLSVRSILPTLYTHHFSMAMKEYVYALFFRYADLIAIQQDEADVEAIFDNPLFVTYEEPESEQVVLQQHDDDDEDELMTRSEYEMLMAFQRLKISVNDHCTVSNEYFYQGEVLFYDQLYRLHLSYKLNYFYSVRSIKIGYTKQHRREDFLQLATLKWAEMCVEVSKDGILRTKVIEDFSALLLDIHLYHGERQRFKRQFPKSTCEARDILSHCRPHQISVINKTRTMPLQDIVVCFKQSYLQCLREHLDKLDTLEAHALTQGSEVIPYLTYELESLLLTQLTTLFWCEMNGVNPITRMKESYILEELTTIEAIESLLLKRSKPKATQKNWPLFLKLMRIYYVIYFPLDGGPYRIFRSLFFIEAHLVWLALCLRGRLIKEMHLHTEIIALVQNLNKLLLL